MTTNEDQGLYTVKITLTDSQDPPAMSTFETLLTLSPLELEATNSTNETIADSEGPSTNSTNSTDVDEASSNKTVTDAVAAPAPAVKVAIKKKSIFTKPLVARMNSVSSNGILKVKFSRALQFSEGLIDFLNQGKKKDEENADGKDGENPEGKDKEKNEGKTEETNEKEPQEERLL